MEHQIQLTPIIDDTFCSCFDHSNPCNAPVHICVCKAQVHFEVDCLAEFHDCVCNTNRDMGRCRNNHDISDTDGVGSQIYEK